jgi:D-alanyl-D-alanine carboxypeptidase
MKIWAIFRPRKYPVSNYYAKAGFFILVVFGISLIGLGLNAQQPEAADEPTEFNVYSIRLDKETIAKGYTVAAFDDTLKLSLVPGILSEDTPVRVERITEPMESPWRVDRVSGVYQFEFMNKAAYDDHKPFYIQFSYDEAEDDNLKKVFFFDKNYNTWRPLPTRDYAEENFVRSLIHLPFARIAVFSYPDVLGTGRASWYDYKPGNYAASPDFPKGSRLRVYNLENDKYVDVTINDYGPDRGRFPGRVIDLERKAFAALAPTWEGTVSVAVEPLYIVPDNQGRVLGVSEQGIDSNPEVSSLAALVMEEDTGEILWEKNSTTTLPLASLTKMMAISVYLDTRPTLTRVVAYDVRDEEYNYEHCKKWESARLRLNQGETLTVEDLIYASLVGSANNTVETLVRVSGLDRDVFIAKMNLKAREWGAEDTHFVEPSGLAPANVTTARDYALIARESLKHPIIEKASTMREYKFTTINEGRSKTLRNTNHIIRTNQFNITGSKTGYLHEAGYCLMTRAENGLGKGVIVITLNAADRDTSFAETTELMQFGLREL